MVVAAIVLTMFAGNAAGATQEAKLTASDGASYDYLGYSVSVYNDTAVIGAYGDDSGKGSAYVFSLSGISDITPPTVTIDHPQENYIYSTSTVALNVSASESIVTWQYNINGTGNVTFTLLMIRLAIWGQRWSISPSIQRHQLHRQ